jgi:predicted Abi (CAAX) family protease
MEDFIYERFQGLILALTTFPDLEAWLWSAWIFLLLVAVVLPIGFQTGLLRVKPMMAGRARFVLLALTLAIRPSLLGELVF